LPLLKFQPSYIEMYSVGPFTNSLLLYTTKVFRHVKKIQWALSSSSRRNYQRPIMNNCISS